MKPHTMTLSAFGSFAGTETIDFTRLGDHGLYIITGETGAGKTTIFDAISYALFGKASGNARHKYQMLRSDYAEGRVKTFVALEFTVGPERYSIRREIIPHVSRATSEITYTDNVCLTLPDQTVLDRDSEVKAKMLDIIGLDREQFAQIVMIAQNDFLRFMQSGTEERVKILRRIFATEKLKDFQEALKDMAKTAKNNWEQILQDFARYSVDHHQRNQIFAQWSQEIVADTVELSGLYQDISQTQESQQTLAGQMAVARALSQTFQALAGQRQARAIHKEKAADMSALADRQKSGEVALRVLKPLYDRALEANNEYNQESEALCKAKEEVQSAQKALAQAQSQLETLDSPDQKQEDLSHLTRLFERASDKQKRLLLIQTDYQHLVAQQSKLEKLRADVQQQNSEYQAADARYKATYQQFIQGQAGILAQNLAPNQPCPVCGSKEHPAPADRDQEAVDEAQLKKLESRANTAKKNLDTQVSKCAAWGGEIDTLTQRFQQDFREYAPDSTRDTAGETLTTLLTHAQGNVTQLIRQKEQDEKALVLLKQQHLTATQKMADSQAGLLAARVMVSDRETREEQMKARLEDAKSKFYSAMETHNFADQSAYRMALLTEEQIADITKQRADYEKTEAYLTQDIARLEAETADKTQPDVASLQASADELACIFEALNAKRDQTKQRLDQTQRILQELRRSAAALDKAEAEYGSVKRLSDCANAKLDFETYVQMTYFERVIQYANQRLQIMSQNRYVLLRKEEGADARRRTGLELEVFDRNTGGKRRSTSSLSGGESFMTSLALALGLSDVVQQSCGGIHLDAMFIDEGFGTLDADLLELAISTLSNMAGGHRIIGIISHVAELRERIDKQIRVEKTNQGSRVSVVV